jgi:hypothetical protein
MILIWIAIFILGVLAEYFTPDRSPSFRVAIFPLIPLIAGGIGALAGGAAKGRAQGRAAEADYGLNRDQLLAALYQAAQNAQLQRYNTEQQAALQAAQGQESGRLNRAGLDLQRRQFALQAPDTRLSQAIRGSLTANARDARATHPRANVVHFEGGPRPSMLNADARKLGELLARQALMAQLAGDKFAPVPETQFPRLTPPTLQTPTESFRANQGALSVPPKATGLDKLLGVTGGIGSLIGALGPLFSEPQKTPRGSEPNFINPNLIGGATPRY